MSSQFIRLGRWALWSDLWGGIKLYLDYLLMFSMVAMTNEAPLTQKCKWSALNSGPSQYLRHHTNAPPTLLPLLVDRRAGDGS